MVRARGQCTADQITPEPPEERQRAHGMCKALRKAEGSVKASALPVRYVLGRLGGPAK